MPDRPTTQTRFRAVSPVDPRLLAIVAGSFVYVAALLWLPRFIDRLDPLTGDEPFYVMSAISLLDDHDLDEQNNYVQRDYYRFYPVAGSASNGWAGYPDPLPPHATAATRPGLYSKHGLGTTLLIALPWAAGGRVLVLVCLAAIAALVTGNMALLAGRYARAPAIVLGVSLALGLTVPLFPFSLLIFPEMPAALCILYATRRLLEQSNSRAQWIATGAAAAFLPWLHYRLVPVSVMFAIVALIRLRNERRPGAWMAFGALPVLSGMLLFWWFSWLYDSPMPPGSDHAGFSGPGGFLNGVAGTAIDQQWGALIHNSVLVLALAAFLPFAWAKRSDAAMILAVSIPYLVLVCAYKVWWGEWNPPGRYLVDVIPLAAAPLAWWLGRVSTRTAIVATLAAAIPAACVMATFAWDPQLMYNQPDGTSRLLETWSTWLGTDVSEAVPSFVFYSMSPLMERWIATAVAGFALMAIGVFALVAVLNAPEDARVHERP